jgi:hypothetical protein
VTLFLLSPAILDLHDLSTRTLLSNRWLRLVSPFELQEFQLSTPVSSVILPPEVDDLSMCVPHRSTNVVHFCSSGFWSFNSQSSLSPKVISPKYNDLAMCVPHISTFVVHFGSSGFGSFNSQSLLSPKVLSPEYKNLSTCVPHSSTVLIHFTLRASGVSTLSILFILERFHLKMMICRHVNPLATNGQDLFRLFSDFALSLSTNFQVVDLAPPIPLDDGRSLASSGLRKILTLVCT